MFVSYQYTKLAQWHIVERIYFAVNTPRYIALVESYNKTLKYGTVSLLDAQHERANIEKKLPSLNLVHVSNTLSELLLTNRLVVSLASLLMVAEYYRTHSNRA